MERRPLNDYAEAFLEDALIQTGIIIGSTRPGRLCLDVARWVFDLANKRSDGRYTLIDIADYGLPLLDEPVPPALAKYSKLHTAKWADTINGLDAFVFVTPEYNHGIPGALKNAIDFLYREWNNKAAGFVSYGSALGVRAVEQLRLVMGELQVADVRAQVMLSLVSDFESYKTFKPNATHERTLNAMLDQVGSWGEAMRSVRQKRAMKPRHSAGDVAS